MSKKTRAPFPSREEILNFIQESPGKAGKREIVRAFQLDGEQKIRLKKELRAMADEGAIQRGHRRTFAEPGTLPNVAVLDVIGTDTDGELLAQPVQWEAQTPPPVVYMAPVRQGPNALGVGDRVLAKLERIDDLDDGRTAYEGRTIRRITQMPTETLGVYLETDRGEGQLRSTNRRHKSHFFIADTGGVELFPGDLVRAEILSGKRQGLPRVRVKEKISRSGPKSISLIAIYDHDIPVTFPESALAEADKAKAATLKMGEVEREDLRTTPLITIDGADARDFDDAVFAEPDPEVDGGWHLIVAIADVSWYVRPGSTLNEEAFKRGNSVYFPDRVVPMLPEALSNGWCSLVPHEERPCLAAHMWIDAGGNLTRHRFCRALMKSAARTTYEQVQAAADGIEDDITAPLQKKVIDPLYGAYRSLLKARIARGVLELDLPEKKIEIGEDGKVSGVSMRPRFDSHKLIEEFMVLANVAAAQALESMKQPCMYRIHDVPSVEKLESLREFLSSVSLSLPKGQVIRAANFNQILSKAKDTPNHHLVNQVVLRSQSQAAYSPDNIGHFGLALKRYCHFTSPIRRYSDLLVHRALVSGLKVGDGGLEKDHKSFAETGEHLCVTERRASVAERDAVDRFAALYLSEKVGSFFAGRISGVTRFGLFVELDETGVDGLVPIRTLANDYYDHDEHRHVLLGRRSGRRYALGDRVDVMLMEADPITGGTVFQVLDGDSDGDGGGRHVRAKKGTGAQTKKPHKPSKPRNPKKPKGKSRASRRRQRSGPKG